MFKVAVVICALLFSSSVFATTVYYFPPTVIRGHVKARKKRVQVKNTIMKSRDFAGTSQSSCEWITTRLDSIKIKICNGQVVETK